MALPIHKPQWWIWYYGRRIRDGKNLQIFWDWWNRTLCHVMGWPWKTYIGRCKTNKYTSGCQIHRFWGEQKLLENNPCLIWHYWKFSFSGNDLDWPNDFLHPIVRELHLQKNSQFLEDPILKSATHLQLNFRVILLGFFKMKFFLLLFRHWRLHIKISLYWTPLSINPIYFRYQPNIF